MRQAASSVQYKVKWITEDGSGMLWRTSRLKSPLQCKCTRGPDCWISWASIAEVLVMGTIIFLGSWRSSFRLVHGKRGSGDPIAPFSLEFEISRETNRAKQKMFLERDVRTERRRPRWVNLPKVGPSFLQPKLPVKGRTCSLWHVGSSLTVSCSTVAVALCTFVRCATA